MNTMGMFARILVPTDFSTGSLKAWKVAQCMAEGLGAELTLLHVLPATPMDIEARERAEERVAELHSMQAAHQLGVPRSADDDETPAPLLQLFEGPLVGDAVSGFSRAGREWAAELETWAAQGRLRGCKVRTVLRVGTPYREVAREAKDHGVDVVVLSTHGRGEIQRLLLGSVADRVIRMAPCPVMTVKET